MMKLTTPVTVYLQDYTVPPFLILKPKRQALMKGALEQVAAAPGLSKETAEVITKALA